VTFGGLLLGACIATLTSEKCSDLVFVRVIRGVSESALVGWVRGGLSGAGVVVWGRGGPWGGVGAGQSGVVGGGQD